MESFTRQSLALTRHVDAIRQCRRGNPLSTPAPHAPSVRPFNNPCIHVIINNRKLSLTSSINAAGFLVEASTCTTTLSATAASLSA